MSVTEYMKQNIVALVWGAINIALAVAMFIFPFEGLSEAVSITLLFFSTNFLFQYQVARQIGQKKAMFTSPLTFLAFNLLIGFLMYLFSAAIKPGDGFYYIALGGYLFVNYIIAASLFLILPKYDLSIERGHYKYIVILLIGFAISTFIYYRDLPSYTTLNTDAFQHMTAMKDMYRNGDFALFLTEINDAFTVRTYLPVFHMIFGPVISAVDLSNVVLTYNLLERSFFMFASIVLYFFLFELTYNKPVALLGALVHLFMFEPTGAYTSFFLLPQTLTGFIGILILIEGIVNGWMNKTYFALVTILIISMHFFIGPVILGLALLLWAFGKVGSSPLWLNKIVIVFLMLLIIGSILTGLKAENLSETLFTDLGSRETDIVTLAPVQVANELFKMLGPLIIFYIWLVIKALINKKMTVVMVAIMVLGISFLLFVQFPYATKLFLILHYLFVIFLVLSLDFEIKVKYIAVATISLCFIFVYSFHLDLSTRTYKDIFYDDENIELITEDEYSASNTVNLEVVKETDQALLISDPLTMSLIEPLSISRTTGGVWTLEKKRVAIWDYLNGNISNDKLLEKLEVEDEKVHILINGRSVTWADYEKEFIRSYSNAAWEPVREDVGKICTDITIREKVEIVDISDEDTYCILSLN